MIIIIIHVVISDKYDKYKSLIKKKKKKKAPHSFVCRYPRKYVSTEEESLACQEYEFVVLE